MRPVFLSLEAMGIGHPSSPVASTAAENIQALFNGSMRDFPETDLRPTVLDLNAIGYVDAARVDASVKILYRFPP
jgi:hypothetical protein